MAAAVAKCTLPWLRTQYPQNAVVSNPSKRQHDSKPWHCVHLRIEKPPAGANFLGDWLVGGWNAANGVGYPAVAKLEAVVRSTVEASVSEAELNQGRIKEVARAVSGERASSTIGAANARG